MSAEANKQFRETIETNQDDYLMYFAMMLLDKIGEEVEFSEEDLERVVDGVNMINFRFDAERQVFKLRLDRDE